ncbi:MAG: hypothetical protein ACXWW4_16585 [Candidatus Binatia bacterium]
MADGTDERYFERLNRRGVTLLRHRQDDAVTGLRSRRWLLLMIMLMLSAMIVAGCMSDMGIFVPSLPFEEVVHPMWR